MAVFLTSTACSSGGNGDDSGKRTSSPTGTEFTPSDRSELVFDVKLPEVQGSAQGAIDDGPASLEVAEVRAAPTGTVLIFWYAGDERVLAGDSQTDWASLPQLVDQGAKKIYEPVTFPRRDGTYCVCTTGLGITESSPKPRTVLYPELPKNVTEVQVRKQGFEPPITVKVTRD